NRINGSSVYRASLKGDDAAVKVLKGDASAEINIQGRISHANITRLSGFCVHKGSTYLVYEFVENGSLDNWIHFNNRLNFVALTWRQRVQIVQDVADALNYLHNYANPSHIH
ncbi:LysM type receptor kinase, partial [Trifolium medium]|nr:LysM type receptor kinase [Trifolium medium]